MTFYSSGGAAVAWAEQTLIIPMEGKGNVAQLAADLLLENISGMARVGYIEHDGLLPMVGNGGEGDATHLLTALEVYQAPEKNVVVLQQRSPVGKRYRASFRKDLLAWIKSCNPAKVVILAGSDSSERIASQLQGPQHRHLLSPKLAGESASLEAAGGIPLEPRHVSEHNPEGIYIHGGGMARALFNDCVKEDLAAAALVHFCSAGDTRQEAGQLASLVHSWLQVFDPEATGLQAPVTWQLCYGTGFGAGLF